MQIKRIINLNISLKFLIVTIISLISVLIFSNPAFACTGVYVGCDVSEDGTSIIARSNDYSPWNCPCYIKVYNGNDGEKLTHISSQNGFEYDLKGDLFRFICLPTSDICDKYGFITSAINENGVSISATLTGYCCEAAMKANPFVEGGIVEDMFPAVVGALCKSAREGVELIAKIIDEKGSGEDNIIMISDQNECWYMEIYGGHQYCAIKAPDDCVCSMGNEFMLDTVDENSTDVICSKDLFSLPQKAGFAQFNPDGKMSLVDTYMGKGNYSDFSHMRTWGTHRLLSPSTVGDYDHNAKYPLFYRPDSKIKLQQVMNIFRDRYDGTKYDFKTVGKDKYRDIATEGQIRTHILQTYKDVPANIACMEWLSFSCAEFSSYIPISNYETEFIKEYMYNPKEYVWDEQSSYECFKKLNAVTSQNRNALEKGIKDYWSDLESYYIKAYQNIINKTKINSNNSDLHSLINNFCCSAQNQSLYDAKRLVNDIEWFLMCYDGTYNKTWNHQTLETKPKEIKTYNPTVDVALFAKMFNWKIEEQGIRQHNPNNPPYDYSKIGNPEQADNGGQEGFIKLNNNNKTIEIVTNNGHASTTGQVISDNFTNQINCILQDGKIFCDKYELDKLLQFNDNDISTISIADTSPNRSLISSNKSLGELFASFPVWGQILVIVTFAVLFIIIGILISNFVIKRQRKN